MKAYQQKHGSQTQDSAQRKRKQNKNSRIYHRA